MSLTSRQYINRMKDVAWRLSNSDSMYYSRFGHIRFAHECGYAMREFDKVEREEFLHTSYGSLYVIGCNLKPIFDNKEWIKYLMEGYER